MEKNEWESQSRCSALSEVVTPEKGKLVLIPIKLPVSLWELQQIDNWNDDGGGGELSGYERGPFYMAVIKQKRGIYVGRMIFEYLYFFCKLFKGVRYCIRTSLHLL